MGVTVEEAMDSRIIKITEHAYDRGKERLGLSKKSLKRMSEKAFDDGLTVDEMNGSLYKYFMDKLEYLAYENTFYRVYGEMIFVFTVGQDIFFGDTHPLLVTVMYVPNELKKQANSSYRRKKIA